MKKVLDKRKGNDVFLKNKALIQDDNVKMMSVALSVCTGIYAALWWMSFFVYEYAKFQILYACTCIIAIILLFIHRNITKDKHVIFMTYVSFSMFFCYACYSSFILSPNYISIIVLLCQIVLPAISVDKTKRVTAFIVLFYFIYILGVFLYKNPDLISDEIINMTTFTLVGIILGYYMRKMKMENYEYRRLATINEHQDFLTNLYNRKKMFADIEELSFGNHAYSAFFMIDVDHFKLFNDTFGHVSGDVCLRKIGACMKAYAKSHHMRIYRFGGEEFAALCLAENTQSYKELAEGLRQAICDLHIAHAQEHEIVTISIGACPCDEDLPFDDVIKRADDVLYEAKRTGRNKVVIYTNQGNKKE